MGDRSNVGVSQSYEAGDQRNPPDSEKAENQATPFEEGKENSHDQQDPSMCQLSEQRRMTDIARRGPALHWQSPSCCRAPE